MLGKTIRVASPEIRICEIIKRVEAGDLAARYVAGILDKRTGEVIEPTRVVSVDAIAGEYVRYVLDERGMPRLLRDERGRLVEKAPGLFEAEKETVRGDFAILWSEDAP